MTNTNDIASVLSTELTAAIEQSDRQNETVRVATTLDISTVAAFAGDHADNVDYVRENDGSYDMWGWSDEMETAAMGETLWRLKVTVAKLRDVWDATVTPIYDVLTDGKHMYDARARRLDTKSWLYVDDSEGYRILSNDELTTMTTDSDCTLRRRDN